MGFIISLGYAYFTAFHFRFLLDFDSWNGIPARDRPELVTTEKRVSPPKERAGRVEYEKRLAMRIVDHVSETSDHYYQTTHLWMEKRAFYTGATGSWCRCRRVHTFT
eukprot:gnl/TRDRNA2_/TRDRNA2_73474_c0_seq1.p2 gnl/TRDRNA2_/TRDRNA2_73474_c0~~gnl/TRDRNA2_/TRDRNA2_73474_c0_seq1.p2  ORF type:complete len:107 (+),score=1.00 gnl/TRDRNA2_/TRDRNA2_73474_c0_seq1:658-978(+)